MAKQAAAPEGQAGVPPQQSYVPARAAKVTKQPATILQQAAKDPNLELWLIQMPSSVPLQSLSGLELSVPNSRAPAAITVAGSSYQLREDIPAGAVAAGSQVVVVLPSDNPTNGQPVTVPVKRRMVMARVHGPGVACGEGNAPKQQKQKQQEQQQEQQEEEGREKHEGGLSVRGKVVGSGQKRLREETDHVEEEGGQQGGGDGATAVVLENDDEKRSEKKSEKKEKKSEKKEKKEKKSEKKDKHKDNKSEKKEKRHKSNDA